MRVMQMSLEEVLKMLDETVEFDNLRKAEETEVELKLTVTELMDCSIALGVYITTGACADMMDHDYIPVIKELKDKLDALIMPVLKANNIKTP